MESKYPKKFLRVSPGEREPKKQGRKKESSILLSQIRINLPQILRK